MATAPDIRSQLDAIADADPFDQESQRLADDWTAEGVGFVVVETVLRFMEDHPDVDFGAPGPLTHLIERFWKQGYEDSLLASISRRPTEHTTWLLNRIINGEKREPVKADYLAVMQRIAANPDIDGDVRIAASEFLAPPPR